MASKDQSTGKKAGVPAPQVPADVAKPDPAQAGSVTPGPSASSFATTSSRVGRPPLYGDSAAPSGTRTAAFRERLTGEGLVRLETYVPTATREDIDRIAGSEGVSAAQAAQALLRYGVQHYDAEQARRQLSEVRNVPDAAFTADVAAAARLMRSVTPMGVMTAPLPGGPNEGGGAGPHTSTAAGSSGSASSPIAAFFTKRKDQIKGEK